MSRRVPRIVAIGDLPADLIVEGLNFPVRDGDFQSTRPVHLDAGGSANLLILLSRLGAYAAAVGCLGEDLWGEQVRRILEAEGVKTEGITPAGTTTVAVVLVDGEGRHAFLGCYGRGGEEALGERQAVIVTGADALFASGYSLSDKRLRILTLDAMNTAGESGIARFFDPGPAFRGLSRELKCRAVAACDVLLLTEDELRELSPGGAEVLLRPGSNSDSASGPHTVVVKRGSDGCRLFQIGEKALDVPAVRVSVRDTTAAGDCFDAGFMMAYLKGRNPTDCARLGICAGAATVQKIGGGRNVPTLLEVQTVIGCSGWSIEM